jgi:hypothetical protein
MLNCDQIRNLEVVSSLFLHLYLYLLLALLTFTLLAFTLIYLCLLTTFSIFLILQLSICSFFRIAPRPLKILSHVTLVFLFHHPSKFFCARYASRWHTSNQKRHKVKFQLYFQQFCRIYFCNSQSLLS